MESKALQHIVQMVEAKLGLKEDSISLLIWKDRIQERLAACQLHSYEEYEQLLNTSKSEMQELIELMVNAETWFFRERGAFDYLAYFVKQAKGKISFFRILSLACSTGEEPYSIAMALIDAGLSLEDFRIDALDISYKVLRKAKAGVYGNMSFRGNNIDFRNHYFSHTASDYIIYDHIKQQVSFYKGNILDNINIFDSHTYHIIFCRNLLIYLNQKAQKKVLNDLKTLLASPGILVVGSAEANITLNAGLDLVLLPGTSIFTMDFEKFNENEKISSQNQIVNHPSLTTKHLDVSFQPSSHLLQLAASLEEKSDKALLLQEALNKANEGDFEEAKNLCSIYIRQYGAHPDIYYLLGLLYHTQSNEEEAKKCLHKAVYLNPSHVEALMCLALLYEGEGKREQAELFRKRAMKNI
jgi:chemotaxis protein methyltransferase WspC